MRTKTLINRYFQPGEITPPFNSILFVNQGTTTVSIRGLILAPGASFADNGNFEENNDTLYRFDFTGVGVNSLLVVIKKIVPNV